MWPFSNLLDFILGPREWCVIITKGTAWAQHRWAPANGEALIRSNLRQGQAQSLALRMREKSDNTPRPII